MSLKLKPLAEQVVVITGASSGIGLVTARMAAARGAKVMLVARNRAALDLAVDEITAAGGTAARFVADVGDAAEVRAAAAKAVAKFGGIDTWVNNAGVTIYAKLMDTPLDEHKRMFKTNYFGAVNGATTAVRHLRNAGGALITVGSIGSTLPTPVMGAYAASKHATKGYIDSLRAELLADDIPISVTLIKPAGIDTPIGQHAANHVDGEARIPPLVYAPELVAEAILDAAQHVRREVTVGGVGRAQELVGSHFPALFDRVAGAMIPMMRDPKLAETPGNALFVTQDAGRERSGIEHGMAISPYTAATRHPVAVAAVAAAAVAGLAGLIFLRGDSKVVREGTAAKSTGSRRRSSHRA